MVIFQDIQDVEEWLEPLDYIAFWDAVAPYDLVLQDRDHCDGLITSGKVEQSLILDGLKALAKVEMTKKFGLSYRTIDPLAAQTLASIH